MVVLLFLILFSIYVVSRAEDRQWKLRNIGIITASMIFGFTSTLFISYISGFPGERSLAIGIMSGYVGLAVAAMLNYWRSGGIYKGKRRPGPPSDKTVV